MLTLIDHLFLFITKPIFGVAGRFGVNTKELERFLKFMVVGTIGFVVDFGILNLNMLMLNFQARQVDLGMWKLFGVVLLNGTLTFSNTISFSSAVISNFTWNYLWTYPESRSKPLVVNLMGLGINLAVLNALNPLCTRVFGLLGYNAAKAIATIVVLFWNFFVNRYWTYSDVE